LFLAFSLADRINSVNREKRKTERALIKSQNEHVLALQRYQDLYESSPIGNFQADKRYQLISVNDACGHLFGFENPEDMLGEVKDIRSYLESDFSDFQNIVREARDKGAVYNQEIHIKDHKDRERWLSISMRFNNDEGVEIF